MKSNNQKPQSGSNKSSISDSSDKDMKSKKNVSDKDMKGSHRPSSDEDGTDTPDRTARPKGYSGWGADAGENPNQASRKSNDSEE